MKIRRKNELPLASREFTDREEPRAAFWNKYNSFKSEMAEGNVRVISYYGIGGIGKSSLLKKLRCEMDERIKKPYYIDYNFEVSTEPKAVLEALRHILQDKYHFSFSLFDLGIYAYSRKIGLNPKLPEIKAFIERSPILGLIGAGLDIIDFAGFARKVLSFADKSVALVRNHLLKHKEELNEIEMMEAADLYAYLPYLFSCDMVTNLENTTEPLVIFLDTYEKLVNEFAATGDTLERDAWLRGENGLILNMPNTLWVIAGREKLKWERFDKDWSEALEQHIVGNLSEKDGVNFLKSAGVASEPLCKNLYALTHGTPVYLDFCVDRYNDISEGGETPDISHFGKDVRQLVTRFAQYMDDSKRDFVYMLAHLGTFNDELITAIAPDVISSFSLSAYERIKGFSFISELPDGRYSIHQTVGEILLADSSDSVRIIGEKIAKAIIPYCDEKTDLLDPSSAEYYIHLQYMRKFGEKEPETLEAESLYAATLFAHGRILEALSAQKELYDKYCEVFGDNHSDTVETLLTLFSITASSGRINEAAALGEKLLPMVKETFGEDSSTTVSFMINYVSALCTVGDYENALKIGEETYEKSKLVDDLDDRTAINLLTVLAIALNCHGRNEDALALNLEALDKATKINDAEAMFSSANAATNSYYNLSRFDEALKCAENAVSMCKAEFSDEHPNFHIAESNRARCLGALGRCEEALAIYNDITEKIAESFGAESLITLIIYNQKADVLEKLGKADEALALNNSLLPKFVNAAGEEHASTQKVLMDIARLSKNRVK